ncbi:hypothetical protein EBR96_00200, partial [bacterium]|nr:hypothetical protein [bacterium]
MTSPNIGRGPTQVATSSVSKSALQSPGQHRISKAATTLIRAASQRLSIAVSQSKFAAANSGTTTQFSITNPGLSTPFVPGSGPSPAISRAGRVALASGAAAPAAANAALPASPASAGPLPASGAATPPLSSGGSGRALVAQPLLKVPSFSKGDAVLGDSLRGGMGKLMANGKEILDRLKSATIVAIGVGAAFMEVLSKTGVSEVLASAGNALGAGSGAIALISGARDLCKGFRAMFRANRMERTMDHYNKHTISSGPTGTSATEQLKSRAGFKMPRPKDAGEMKEIDQLKADLTQSRKFIRTHQKDSLIRGTVSTIVGIGTIAATVASNGAAAIAIPVIGTAINTGLKIYRGEQSHSAKTESKQADVAKRISMQVLELRDKLNSPKGMSTMTYKDHMLLDTLIDMKLLSRPEKGSDMMSPRMLKQLNKLGDIDIQRKFAPETEKINFRSLASVGKGSWEGVLEVGLAVASTMLD